jgi:hypothetical protein
MEHTNNTLITLAQLTTISIVLKANARKSFGQGRRATHLFKILAKTEFSYLTPHQIHRNQR